MLIPAWTRRNRLVLRIVVSGFAAGAVVTALTACSGHSTSDESDADRTETFEFSGSELKVKNDYANIDVEHGESGTITISESRTVIGTAADEPEWTLEDGTLDLGQTCASTIGICDVSYLITVPDGTTVTSTETVEDAG